MTADKHKTDEREISAERKAYEQKIEAQIDELGARMELLRAKANQATADAKIKITERLGELRTQQAETERKLQNVREAGEDAWKELRSGMDDALKSLQNGVEQAISKFE